MSDPAAPPPALLPWVLASATAIVLALWVALRASISSELTFVKGELAAERKRRDDEHAEWKAELLALRAELHDEREGQRLDNERSATALWQARGEALIPSEWECEAPTKVRRMLAVASIRPVDLALKRADETAVEAWGEATPPRG